MIVESPRKESAAYAETMPVSVSRSPSRHNQWLLTLGTAVRSTQGMLGLVLAGLVVLIAVVGPALAPYGPTEFVTDTFTPPNWNHLLGGDALGRDVLSRVLSGGWVLLLMGLASAIVGLVIGGVAGISAAYLRGKTDNVIMRSIDVVLSFPQVVFVLMLVSIIGPQPWLIVLSVGLTMAPPVARVLRAATMDISERDYVKQVELQGVAPFKVMFSEILPNLVSPLMVEVGMRFTYSIALTSAVAFLGFGQPPPAANWGGLINENRLGLDANPWAVVVPAALLALLTIGTNIFTDAIARVSIGLARRSDDALDDDEAGEPALPHTMAPLSGRSGALRGDGTDLEASRLEVQDLTISLSSNGAEVVKRVSFTVAAGEMLGLVGESGSGKTTVALALLGYTRRGLEVTSGRVLLDGVDLLALDPDHLRGLRGVTVAHVPQDPAAALNPALKVGTQLREALSVHPDVTTDIDVRIAEVLKETRLDTAEGLLDRYPHQLSGGQQQRVALAMAFACRPSLMVFDEPTTGLDVSTQRHVLDIVRSLCSAYGVAAVYVSHDLAVVRGLVSQVAVMYAGQVIELGSTAAVLSEPLHPYTQGLLAAVPSPERAELLIGIEGRPPRLGRLMSGCAFRPRCPHALERCRIETPPLRVVERRVVRCIRAHEIGHHRAARLLATHAEVADGPDKLILRDVTAHYGSHRVLTSVDLDLRSNRCVAVVGESGSGKTTLARCVVGLHTNWSGTIRVLGTAADASCHNRPKELLRTLQYIGQNPYTSLNPRKTIGQILSQPLQHFFALSPREREERVYGALRDVSLGDGTVARFPSQLSGGERQRIAIARALIVDPQILVCDEITSSLDVSVQASIIELLRRLQHERQLAMIFITHTLALVRTIAQSAFVLHHGRVVEAGHVDDILQQPQHPYTIQLVQDVPRLQISIA